ncbi:helix-turn-helix domain-containing protein [Saccharibacillus sp. CPCC 101409]|uniref:TetR/AcrR family transcriptional regulator n=1 Tax=Saccharibacillus sp. CPCC 101409 TaxID=3058041 RepID=UPI00267154F4|nr:TetR/AcrR family transcriptional regulator [Saccharibacillus sp. CPCC 101409]MDO3412403.1 helix-turn-helix domain-containing protein [Saccharibacillus sp. CPCC 101409]
MAGGNSLRADAQRNRERIVAAAEDVFRELGAGASLENVAKRAGVGIGTLYRRFPTREALLAETYSDRFLSFAQTSRERSAELDSASAVRAYLEELALLTSVYRGLAASLGTVLQVGTPGCHATSEEGMRLLDHAQKIGVIRSDINFEDVIYIVTAISLAVEQEDSPKSRIAHLVGLFLDGIGVR